MKQRIVRLKSFSMGKGLQIIFWIGKLQRQHMLVTHCIGGTYREAARF